MFHGYLTAQVKMIESTEKTLREAFFCRFTIRKGLNPYFFLCPIIFLNLRSGVVNLVAL
jgi:hypothetical protein